MFLMSDISAIRQAMRIQSIADPSDRSSGRRITFISPLITNTGFMCNQLQSLLDELRHQDTTVRFIVCVSPEKYHNAMKQTLLLRNLLNRFEHVEIMCIRNDLSSIRRVFLGIRTEDGAACGAQLVLEFPVPFLRDMFLIAQPLCQALIAPRHVTLCNCHVRPIDQCQQSRQEAQCSEMAPGCAITIAGKMIRRCTSIRNARICGRLSCSLLGVVSKSKLDPALLYDNALLITPGCPEPGDENIDALAANERAWVTWIDYLVHKSLFALIHTSRPVNASEEIGSESFDLPQTYLLIPNDHFSGSVRTPLAILKKFASMEQLRARPVIQSQHIDDSHRSYLNLENFLDKLNKVETFALEVNDLPTVGFHEAMDNAISRMTSSHTVRAGHALPLVIPFPSGKKKSITSKPRFRIPSKK